MALLACPDCTTEVSDQAEACPKCARPMTKKSGTAKKKDIQKLSAEQLRNIVQEQRKYIAMLAAASETKNHGV